MQKDMTHKPASAPRGRPMLRDAMSPSEGCEREGIVGGDEGPVGGVAQVVRHGVKVVGVHGEEGQEKDEEVR